jgi:hypothetical protein
MVTVIQEPESYGSQMGRALGGSIGELAAGYGQRLSQQRQQSREDEAIKRLTGQDVSGLSPEMKKIFVQNMMKKKEDKRTMMQTGLQTLDKMEMIKNRGNIGRGAHAKTWLPFTGETRRDVAEYEQLGKSLIPLVAAGVPVRNQKEFEEYKKTIADASASDDEIQGAINGLRDLFSRILDQEGGFGGEEEEAPRGRRERPPLSSFAR